MPDLPQSLFELSPAELDALAEQWGWPRFRARQIRKWVFQKNTLDVSRMTDLPANLREELPRRLDLSMPEVKADQLSRDGTHKLLLVWPDGAEAETVMIPDGDRRTGRLVEYNPTAKIFSNPDDERTEQYVTGRFG